MEKTGMSIICPYCRKEIPLDEALTHQISEKIRGELREELSNREAELKTRIEALAAKEKEVAAAREKQERELEAEKGRLGAQYQADLKAGLAKAGEDAQKQAVEKVSLELTDLRQQVEEKAKAVKEFQEKELQLRKEKRALEEEKQNLELEVQRKLDAERENIRKTAEQRASEEHLLKMREKDKLIEDLKSQTEELKRRIEQGSQQLQGEVLELELEDMLRTVFVHDTVEPVPKGMRGADVMQKVCGPKGDFCGTIIWESKRTKAWSDGWIDKLKEDQREARADVAVIVSTVLPKEMSGIGQVNGVWVTEYPLAVGLATALRTGLVQVAMAKQSAVGKNEKMDMLYGYLCGPEFRQQIEGIVEAFVSMRKDLDQEKRAMEKVWAKREKQIDRVVKNCVRMYGSMQGIIGGAALPELKSLDLPAIGEGDEG
jgi:hypothetical protein